MAKPAPVKHIAHMGIGDAILRLVRSEMKRSNGTRLSSDAASEIAMLVEALNAYDLEVAFDCDEDGQPDTVEVFQAAADTGCCRLVPTGRPGPVGKAKKKKKRADNSRRRRG